MLHTPHDFKYGADYSEDFYDRSYDALNASGNFFVFLMVVCVIAVIGLLAAFIFW